MKNLISSRVIINEMDEAIVAADDSYCLREGLIDPDTPIRNYLHEVEMRRITCMKLTTSGSYRALCCPELVLRLVLPDSIKTHWDLLFFFRKFNSTTLNSYVSSH